MSYLPAVTPNLFEETPPAAIVNTSGVPFSDEPYKSDDAPKIVTASSGSFGKRAYQDEAVAAVLGQFSQKVDSTLLVMSTGTGKTPTSARIVDFAVDKGHKVLWLAHREELITQAVKTFRRMGLRVGVEKADQNARPDFEKGRIQVVVATPQTLSIKRLKNWDPLDFKLICCDEAHHAIAKTYRRVFDYFEGARLLGMTATADRLDKANLGRVFESVAYTYPIDRAVREGWLVPIVRRRLEPQPPIDLRQLNLRGGDFSAEELEVRIQENIGGIANVIRQTRWEELGIGNRPTICFTPEVGSAEAVAAALCSIGIPAEHVSCYSKNRRQIIENFRRGRFQVLVNAMLLTEGADFPFVSCILLLRPSMSRALVTQMIGRGTRPPDDNPLSKGKKDCLLLDFAWLLDKHKLTHPVELYNDGEIGQDVMERAAQIMDAEGEEDVQKAVEQAKEEVEVERAQEAERMRIEVREREVRFRSFAHDPLGVAETLGVRSMTKPDDVKPQFHIEPPPWLVESLRKLKVPNPETLTFQDATKLRSTLMKRIHKGLATHGQVQYMISMGMPAAEARRVPFKEAGEIITKLKESKGK